MNLKEQFVRQLVSDLNRIYLNTYDFDSLLRKHFEASPNDIVNHMIPIVVSNNTTHPIRLHSFSLTFHFLENIVEFNFLRYCQLEKITTKIAVSNSTAKHGEQIEFNYLAENKVEITKSYFKLNIETTAPTSHTLTTNLSF